MAELTINLPDDIAEQVSRLPDPQGFVSRLVANAFRNQTPEPTGEGSKWARLVTEIESLPGLGEYEATLRRDQKEFRRSFRFKHDKP